MASRTIRPTESPAPAPFAYTVSAPDGFAPEAVFASWDGTGAGGDFLPCVSYYNADGVLLDRAFPTTGAVTAGDTADVGYRPFERGGGGGGTGTPLTTTDGATTVTPTHTLTIDGGLTLADLGAGNAQIAATATPLVYTTAYCTLQTSSSAGGINFPRVNLVQLRGNGVTYGASPFGNLGTTLTITDTGIYLIGFSIAAMKTDNDGQAADLSFGPDGFGGTWAPGESPFGVNARIRVAESWNVQGLGVGGPQGGLFVLHITAGETLSWGLGSGAVGINVTVDHGLFALVKVA